MKKLIICIVLLTLVRTSSATIATITSFYEATHMLNQLDAHAIVLFDVDEVLIAPRDNILLNWGGNTDIGKQLLADHKQLVNDRYEYLWSKVYLSVIRHIIEPCVIDIITSLQQKNIMTLALTFIRVGSYGIIDSIENHRVNELRTMHIDFSPSYAHTIVFKECPQFNNHHPLIHKGIIFTNNYSKGKTLRAFLQCLDYVPSQIIFFDDLLQNLQSVEEEMAELGIPFCGYHYTAVEHNRGVLDPDIIKYQLDYLHTHETWLTEQEAAIQLNKYKFNTNSVLE